MKPLGSLFLLVNVLSLAFHSDTHLNRGSAQSFLSPSALAVYTSYQNDLIVIEYGKWMTSIFNQHCLKIENYAMNHCYYLTFTWAPTWRIATVVKTKVTWVKTKNYHEHLTMSNMRRKYKELQKTDWKGVINIEKRTTKDPRKKRR